MFTRVKSGFFQFCSGAYWFFSTHIYKRLPTHFVSVFTKKQVSNLPNTLVAKIFMGVEIGNWHQKTQLEFTTAINPVGNIPAIITAEALTRVKTDFLELVFLSMPVCYYVTRLMLEFTMVFPSEFSRFLYSLSQ